MNDYELNHLSLLNRIAVALESIALTNAPAPNFVKPIAAYADFDFTAIGALVRQRDAHGPTELEWGGYLWTRRSPQNKFGEAIWFSRATGKDAEGNVKYVRLITFKKMGEAEPLPRKVEAMVERKAPNEQPEKAAAPSELDVHFGTKKITDTVDEPVWPKSEAEFILWLKAQGLNGKETYQALGADANTWLRKNPQMSWADAARQVKAHQVK